MVRNTQFFGLLMGILTFLFWGFFPIYFKQLEHVGAIEVLAHRIVWSVVFLAIFIAFTGRVRHLKRTLRVRKAVLILAVTGALITVNWGTYVYAVTNDKILESSLGYFMNPLMSMLLGGLILKEKISFLGKISIFIVFIAICLQVISLGKLPIISLVLAASFAFYGLFKKQVHVDPVDGLFIETTIISVFAFIYLTILGVNGGSNLAFDWTGFLLVFSGVVTVLPLLTFNIAANSLKLSTLGFLQYISPTLQAAVAVFIYHESLESARIWGFILIWISIILVTFDGMRRSKNA